VFQGKSLSCTVNPAAGNERALALRPTESPRSVLVIGGGPGGMQAAMTAAERGHRVQLWERSDRLGGNLIPASVPEFKRDLRDLTAYLSREVYRSGVGVRLGMEADAARVESAGADVVILATGARPVMPELEGAAANRVVTALQLLGGASDAGDDVLVMGGGLVGCETALWLAQSGRRVTVVEMLDRICEGEHQANRQHLVKLISDAEVRVRTGSTLSEITAEGGVATGGDATETIRADTIVLAVGMRAENTLYDSLAGRLPVVHRIGDCVKPRRVMEAMWEGYRIARLI
jgi:2-enoate reductase